MTNAQLIETFNNLFDDLLVVIPKTKKELKNKVNTIFDELKIK